MPKSRDQQTIEAALESLYKSPEPSPEFMASLEAQLLSQSQVQVTIERHHFTGIRHWLHKIRLSNRRSFSRPRLAAAVLLIILLFALTLTIIGPQRVLASLQNWIGYVPGIGFVDLTNTRLLAAPLSQTRAGVTLQVEQLIAQPDETLLLFSAGGLPPLTEAGYDSEELPSPQLRLPDGTTLLSDISQLSYGRGHYTFPPLPPAIYRVTLLLPRLPLVPAHIAPENWELPLTLQPADGQWIAELYPQPYQPDGAEVTHNGVTLRIIAVAHAAASTAIQAQVTWGDQPWQHHDIIAGRYLPFLRDDLGHIYQQTHENSSSVAVVRAVEETESPPLPEHAYKNTLTFAAVSPVAHELTLVLDALEFDTPTNEAFTIDLGPNPQIGDTFPLNVLLHVADFPVRLTEARLVEVIERYHPDRIEKPVHLVFTIAPVAAVEGRVLRGIHFESAGFNGSSSGYSLADDQLRSTLILNEDSTIPVGTVEVQVTRATVELSGPWSVNWTLPGSAETGMQPLTIHPAVTDIQNEVTVRVTDMTLTDRVTAVRFRVGSRNSGGSIMPYAGPDSRGNELYLTDDRGGRYEPADWTVQWYPDVGHPMTLNDPNRIMFPSLDPLARQATIHVPAVSLPLSTTASLSLTLTSNITLHPDENPMLPLRSDLWPINISLSLDGYELIFSQAWLQEINPGQVLLKLETADLPTPDNGRWLRDLYVKQVTGPQGLLPVSEWTRGSVGLFDPPGIVRVITSEGPAENGPPPTYRAILSIDLGQEATPGTYHIQLAGVGLQIDGPWTLTVALP